MLLFFVLLKTMRGSKMYFMFYFFFCNVGKGIGYINNKKFKKKTGFLKVAIIHSGRQYFKLKKQK